MQRSAPALLFVSAVLAFTGGCKKSAQREVSPQAARMELSLRGIPFKEKNFVESAFEGDEWAVRLFIAAGMSPDVQDAVGRTPLQAAVSRNHYTVARILLDRNPNVNLRDKDGLTPLLHAVSDERTEIVKLLMKAGADPNAADKDGWTPLHFAASVPDPEIADALIGGGANIHARDNSGATPLQWSAFYNQLALTQNLVERGADPNATNKVGGTPLMVATARGHAEIVAILIAAGAKLDLRDNRKKTASDWAREANQVAVIRMLVEADFAARRSSSSKWPAPGGNTKK